MGKLEFTEPCRCNGRVRDGFFRRGHFIKAMEVRGKRIAAVIECIECGALWAEEGDDKQFKYIRMDLWESKQIAIREEMKNVKVPMHPFWKFLAALAFIAFVFGVIKPWLIERGF